MFLNMQNASNPFRSRISDYFVIRNYEGLYSFAEINAVENWHFYFWLVKWVVDFNPQFERGRSNRSISNVNWF